MAMVKKLISYLKLLYNNRYEETAKKNFKGCAFLLVLYS